MKSYKYSNKNMTLLSDIAVGDTFEVGIFEFIVLEQGANYSKVLLKDFWKEMPFDNNSNDYKLSIVRNSLNTKFYSDLLKYVGKNNILKHKVDLTAMDGRKEYGACRDFVSLLTCDMYRKYVEIIDKYKGSIEIIKSPVITKDWWWFSTPYSTKANGYFDSVCICNRYGAIYRYSNYNKGGIRPFCILKSDIFVEVKDDEG